MGDGEVRQQREEGKAADLGASKWGLEGIPLRNTGMV